VLVTIASAVTRDRAGSGAGAVALTAGYDRAFLVAGALIAAGAIAAALFLPWRADARLSPLAGLVAAGRLAGDDVDAVVGVDDGDQ
jgi:hypothetical protein